MSKVIRFLVSITIVYFFFFSHQIPLAKAANCVINLTHKDQAITSSSVVNITIKAPNETLGNSLQCTYIGTVNQTQQLIPLEHSFTQYSMSRLDPGLYTIDVKPNTCLGCLPLILPIETVCGKCNASFQVLSGNQGLYCLSCPEGYSYASTGKNCIKENNSKWQEGNPNPIVNCPASECNQDTNKCTGAPLRQVTGTPSLGCCMNGYTYDESSKTCKVSGKPDRSSLCTGRFTCDSQTQKCTEPPPCKDPSTEGFNKDKGDIPCSNAGGQPCPNNPNGVMTALGCIPTEPTALVQDFLKFATGIGGAIALLLMIAGSFQMITSQGNPETVKKGQEQFTSAVIGLLFIIFSVLLLQVIGFDILRIPGFL